MSDRDNKRQRVKVLVSDDRLQATIELLGVKTPDYVPPDADEIIAALRAAKIALDDDVRARVDEFVVHWADDADTSERPTQQLVAQGTAAVDAQDGRFEWAEEVKAEDQNPDDQAQIDYFALNSIVTVAEGTTIGRIVPPTEGVPGRDVYGAERPPRKPKGMPIKPGPGIKLGGENSEEAIAETAGRVIVKDGKIRISEVLEIPGDVDFSSGSVDACVDVAVRGTVRSNFHVHTTHSLSVDRVIEAADVRVGGDVHVRGGIFGQDGQGHVRADGSVTAALLNEVNVIARGDVYFNKEILNSRVRTLQHLIGERGTIIGGDVWAREGMSVKVLGSEASVATIVAVGINVDTLRRVRKLEREIKEAEKTAEQVRTAVQPLVANLKRLLPAQRERATELICKADEMDLHVGDLQQRCQELVANGRPQGQPSIMVSDAVFPGVQLTVDGRMVRVQRLLHGPVKLELRKVDGATEVVAVNQRTGSVTVLHSGEPDLDAPPQEDDFAPIESEQQDGSEQQVDHERA